MTSTSPRQLVSMSTPRPGAAATCSGVTLFPSSPRSCRTGVHVAWSP
ncbi:hypothetical protein [Rathayibacter sp. AY1C4]|nr:hypothetical protein [Rathayibacter sp. AY1C4]